MSLSKLLKSPDCSTAELLKFLEGHVPLEMLKILIENMYEVNLVKQLLLHEGSNPLKDDIFSEVFPPNNPWNSRGGGQTCAMKEEQEIVDML